ncbi:type III-B CRISPR system CMR subunit Cmr7 [Saccharolobus islandicus]|uniref:type III-B CRISPR system CMR subunit Cmr7 n=1 Tax=Saccharolobus islandicus TaxID=43080 RepID=UPI00036012B7|nr:type III-B CRISPR system CMR subunit Cmr7 [Sulfolobus islandicus]
MPSEKTTQSENYVFVPLVNNVNYKYDSNSSTLEVGTITIKTNSDKNKHITKIEEKIGKNNKKYVEIHNILVLTTYAINENRLGLVHTLDPCDYVKGILINGEIELQKKQDEGSSPSQPTQQQEVDITSILISKDEVMNKLYFIKKFNNINLQSNIKINFLTIKPDNVGKTKFNSLNINDKIKGIMDLYGIQDNDAIEDLIKKLNEIINYYST